MYTITLDICIESDTSELSPSEIKELFDTYSITPKLITKIGPAGGNPVYQFTAPTKSDIVRFLTEQYFDPEYHSTFITEI